MPKPAIASEKDIEAFFEAYNAHDWDALFCYMSSACVWDACEKRVEGKQNIIDYWTEYHAAFKETLGKPEKVLFGDHMVYLQVKIRLEFLQEGAFFGKTCKKGEALDFICADFYELDDEGKIVSGYVYIKFFNS